jgi:hypothetical protein
LLLVLEHGPEDAASNEVAAAFINDAVTEPICSEFRSNFHPSRDVVSLVPPFEVAGPAVGDERFVGAGEKSV